MRGVEAEAWRVPRPDRMARWGGDALVVLLGLGLVAAIALAPVAARTVYVCDAAEVCAVALLPAEAALLMMASPPGWWDGRLDGLFDKGLGAVLNAAAGLFLLLVMLPVNAALSLNQWGDRSAGAPQRLTVLDRQEHAHKGGRRSYTLGVEPAARRPLGPRFRVTLFDGPKEVTVTRAAWLRAEPGRSTLTLTVHPGLFGFAWIEDGARVEP